MHDAEFAAAMAPPRFTVLGLPLLNYTIGHELLLWQRKNPIVTDLAGFISSDRDSQLEALMGAVAICCERTPAFVWLWKRCCAWRNVVTHREIFLEYLAAGSRDLPTVKMPKVSGHPYHYFGGPEVARLINYVTRRHKEMIAQHFEGSPLNFPFGLARMLYLVDAECEGSVWIENYHDQEARRQKEEFNRLHPDSTFAMGGDEEIAAMAQKLRKEFPDLPLPPPIESKNGGRDTKPRASGGAQSGVAADALPPHSKVGGGDHA